MFQSLESKVVSASSTLKVWHIDYFKLMKIYFKFPR